MSCDNTQDVDQFTEDSSNIIPSSESDPPPPVVCFAPLHGPADHAFRLSNQSEHSEYPTASEASEDQTGRNFTQADDFQDLVKESEKTSSNAFLDSQSHSAYQLNPLEGGNQIVVPEQQTIVTKNCDADLEINSTPLFTSLPEASSAEQTSLAWIKACNFPPAPPRGSTPVHLTFMTNNTNFSLGENPPESYKGIRSSEPVLSTRRGIDDATLSPEAFHNGSVEEPSVPDSTICSLGAEAIASSKTESPTESKPTPTTVDSRASDPLISTSSTTSSSGHSARHGFTGRRLSVHLSVMSAPMDSTFSRNESLILDGFNIEVGNLSKQRLLDRLTAESYRLFTRIENTFCAVLQSSDESKSDSSDKHSNVPRKGDGKFLESKPIVSSSARTSSSSSDLFIPRKERAHVKRLLGSMFDVRPKLAGADIPISTARSSSSAPESSPGAVRQSSSSSTVFTSPTSRPGLPSKDASTSPVKPSEVHTSEPYQGSTYAPSLALVLETPSEETEEKNTSPRQHEPFPRSAYSKTVVESDTLNVSVNIDSKDQSLCSANDGSSIFPTAEEVILEGRIPVYGKWHSEPYYYAGSLELPQTGSKRLVHFDDGSKASLKPSEVIFINLLPVNCEVCADWSNSGEYWSNCVVEAHLMDSRRPYQIFCRANNERKALCRKDVSIHQSQLKALKSMVRLPPTPLLVVQPSASSHDLSRAATPCKKSTLSEVSLENVVFSKRKAKVNRYRTSWLTPITRLAAQESEQASANKPDAKQTQQRGIPSQPRSSSSSRSAPRTKRSHVASAQSATEAITDSKKKRLASVSSASTYSSSEEYEQNPVTRTTSDVSGPISLASPLPPDSSTSIFLRNSLSSLLGIPIPRAEIFANWTIVFTGPTASADQPDRNALEQLVLACGGQIAQHLRPSMLPYTRSSIAGTDTESQSRRNIALVSPGCCRTLKYFQALATLGRVPMVHTDWLLDACRAADATTDENLDPGVLPDWPLHVLLTNHGQYELPRGYPTGSDVPVNGLSVPPVYRLPAYRSLPAPSLFSLRSNSPSDHYDLVAIVTDDTEVFGPAWSNILTLASGASLFAHDVQASTKRVPIFSHAEAPKYLSQLLSKRENPKPGNSLVLIDVNELPVRTVTTLESLPCQLVTCDYFIQSLIFGYLVNPNDSPLFVPPLH